MGIKIKHLDHALFNANLIGDAVAQVIGYMIAPWDGIVIDHMMAIGTAGVTGSQVGDLKINGTSIYTTTGNRPTVTTGTSSQKNTAAIIDGVRTFSKGDLLSMNIATIHSGTAAVGTAMRAVLKKRVAGSVAEYEE